MAKNANLNIRIEPEVKAQAEEILTSLGLTTSMAVNLFFKQIIMTQGIPFEVKLPEHPLDVSKMTPEELDAELEKGLNSESRPAEEVFAELWKEFGYELHDRGQNGSSQGYAEYLELSGDSIGTGELRKKGA